MPEDVIGKLTRFTPAAGLDRDELLFRAGRASAPSPRWWKVAAGVLAVGQAVTVAAWVAWPRPEPQVVHVPVPTPAPAPAGYPAPDDGPSGPPAASSYFVLSRSNPDAAYRPTDAGGGPPTPKHVLTAGWRGGAID